MLTFVTSSKTVRASQVPTVSGISHVGSEAMMPDTHDLSAAQIEHRLATIGAQFQVASDTRRDVLHRVVDSLLDQQALLRESARV